MKRESGAVAVGSPIPGLPPQLWTASRAPRAPLAERLGRLGERRRPV